jgi:hypothetical protein
VSVETLDVWTDCAEITDRLFIGSDPAPQEPFGLLFDGRRADVVVSLIHTGARAVERGRQLIVWPIKDGPIPDPVAAQSLARLVASHLANGSVVYIHCSAGYNRAALMAGLVLIEQGLSPKEAVATVRQRRQGSLSDEYASWLRHRPRSRRRRVALDRARQGMRR